MRSFPKLAMMALAAVSMVAMPALADPGRGHHGRSHGHHYSRHIAHCPPGLAKKNPPCVPPGQTRKQVFPPRAHRGHVGRYGVRVGDVLRIDGYRAIHHPRRLNLEERDGWRYYRDGNRVYRVDRDSRQILSVINLLKSIAR